MCIRDRFCSPVKLPELVFRAVDFLGDLNTPLAMLSLGCFLAQIDLRECFTDQEIWKVSAVRLLLIPAIAIVLLLFIPLDHMSKICLLYTSLRDSVGQPRGKLAQASAQAGVELLVAQLDNCLLYTSRCV